MKDNLGQVLILMIVATSIGTGGGLWLGSIFEESGRSFMIVLSDVLSSSSLLVVAGILGSLVSVRLIGRIDPMIALGRTK